MKRMTTMMMTENQQQQQQQQQQGTTIKMVNIGRQQRLEKEYDFQISMVNKQLQEETQQQQEQEQNVGNESSLRPQLLNLSSKDGSLYHSKGTTNFQQQQSMIHSSLLILLAKKKKERCNKNHHLLFLFTICIIQFVFGRIDALLYPLPPFRSVPYTQTTVTTTPKGRYHSTRIPTTTTISFSSSSLSFTPSNTIESEQQQKQEPLITTTTRGCQSLGQEVQQHKLQQQKPQQVLQQVLLSCLLGFVLTMTSPFQSIPSAYAATATASTTTALPTTTTSTTTATKYNKNVAVIEEVWTLIDKYYINRQNIQPQWSNIRTKYVDLAKQLPYTTTTTSTTNGVEDSNTAQGVTKVAIDMVRLLNDKYSRILDSQQYAAIQKYDLIGVGVSLMPDPASSTASSSTTKSTTPRLIVGSPPVPGSAAESAGLHQGDIVTAINGISTTGKNAFDVIDQIAENPNAPTITMSILKKDNTNNQVGKQEETTTTVTMPRTFNEIKNPIRYYVSEIPTTNKKGTSTVPTTTTKVAKVGYIAISEFNSLIKGNIEQAINQLENVDHVDAYVIDLRQNTGGAFQSAVEISSYFLVPTQTLSSSASVSDTTTSSTTTVSPIVTYVVDNTNQKTPFRVNVPSVSSSPGSDEKSSLPVVIQSDHPIVLFVDSRTASASEVFVGALHDNCRAVVMGNERTFGKGLIQAVYGLQNYNLGLVLTVASYVTPSGTSIQGVGIVPDVTFTGQPYTTTTSTSGTSTTMNNDNNNNINIPFVRVVSSMTRTASTNLQLNSKTPMDLSFIDFDDIQNRLNMCTIPK